MKLTDPCWTAWWDDIWHNEETQFDNEEWRKTFRMRRETFEDLVDEVSTLKCMQKKSTRFRRAIPVAKRGVLIQLCGVIALCY